MELEDKDIQWASQHFLTESLPDDWQKMSDEEVDDDGIILIKSKRLAIEVDIVIDYFITFSFTFNTATGNLYMNSGICNLSE